jgi:preprotein translocase subunit SecD
MKSVIILILSIIISLPIISVIQKPDNGKTYILQATGRNAPEELFRQSADIISSRLSLFGYKSFEVKVAGSGQIKIQMSETKDLAEIEGLLTSKGEISFYETLTQDEISELLKTDTQLSSLLSRIQEQKSNDPRIGCTTENRQKVDEHLNTSAPLKSCRFLWGSETDQRGYCLFALKVNSDGRPLLARSDIDSVKFVTSADPGDARIQIKLKPAAAGIFADVTKKNLNKAIAIVIDNRVYSWPVVRNTIEGGRIEVTGNFSEKEIKYFPVIFNTGQLPVSFKLLK